MTEQNDLPKEAENKSSKTFTLVVVIALSVIAVIGFVAGLPKGVSEKLVENALDEWAEYYTLEDNGSSIGYDRVEKISGEDAYIVYDIVWAHKLEEALAASEGEEAEELEHITVYIPELKVEPKDSYFKTFQITHLQPFTVEEKDETSVFSFSPPLTTFFELSDSDNGQKLSYSADYPETMEIEMKQKAHTVIANFGLGSKVTGSYSFPDMDSGDMQLALSSIKGRLDSDEEEVLTIDGLELNSTWFTGEDAKGAASFALKLSNLFADETSMPYGAVSVLVDGDYSGPMDVQDETIDWTKEKALVDIRDFSVRAKDVALNAKLQFQTGRGEVLPVGSGLINVENFAFVLSELRSKELLDEQAEQMLALLVKQITGTSLDEVKNLNVPIKRVDGGSLEIGSSSFEELFTIVLTGGAMLPSPALQAPAQPEPGMLEQLGEEAEEVIEESEVKALFDE